MRRRDLVAGIGSLGVLGGGVALLRNGMPSIGDDSRPEPADEDGSNGPVEVETIDARGSEAGTVQVPADRVTVVSFFVTGCGQCQAHMPHLAEARRDLRDDYGSDVRFLSVTYQSLGKMPPEELRDWWAAHDGNWAVGYDPNSSLSASYGVVGYPVTVVIDADGENRWQEKGVLDPETIVEAAEPVLDARQGASTANETGNAGDTDEESTSTA
ncbi:TlpA family protein disulfide reductase [Halosolutus halophilus]|uniref:TlpA family protein disulfide reductase n=1 Tax=Halosolutus halophilus TaxID=1552990 RepID=UPI0022351A4B|nr:TlpA disulfide reductase family protein [Halosolutus halophilus]